MSPTKIRLVRQTMRMTQHQFVSLLGITQPTLCKLEAGTLRTDKYDQAIRTAYGDWQTSKVQELENEIIYLKTLLESPV